MWEWEGSISMSLCMCIDQATFYYSNKPKYRKICSAHFKTMHMKKFANLKVKQSVTVQLPFIIHKIFPLPLTYSETSVYWMHRGIFKVHIDLQSTKRGFFPTFSIINTSIFLLMCFSFPSSVAFLWKKKNTHLETWFFKSFTEGCAHLPLSYALLSCKLLLASVSLNKGASLTVNK